MPYCKPRSHTLPSAYRYPTAEARQLPSKRFWLLTLCFLLVIWMAAWTWSFVDELG